MELSEAIDELMASPAVTDVAGRAEHIRALVTPDFIFVDPEFVAAGAKGAADAFGWHRATGEVVRTSAVEVNHGNFFYSWARRDDGEIVAEGYDFGSADRAGRIRRIVSFLVPVPDPRSAPVRHVA